MHRNKTLLAVLATGSLMGLASIAQAAPAVVANTPYGPTTAPYGTVPYGAPTTPYPTTVYTQPGETVLVQPAPPAPLYEAVPAPRAGYVWAPGHYVWDSGRYIWQSGHWIEARPGYAWEAPHWQQRPDGSWALVNGAWVRSNDLAYNPRGHGGPNGDLDGDGIRNADDDDRDGDGVVNWRDRYPRDQNRS
jgi:hypothetical protein